MDDAPAPDDEGSFFLGLTVALMAVAPFWVVVVVAAWRAIH